MPAFAVDQPVAPEIPQTRTRWFSQYDLDPAALRPWNAVGNWAFFNAQPNYVNAGFFGNGFGAAPGIGDSIEFRFVMTQGCYLFRLWTARNSDCGQIAITMNGYSVVPTIDFYAGVLAPSYFYLNLNRLLVADGLQRLVLTVKGKAGGSSNFYVRLYGIQFAPYLPGVIP